MGEGPRTDWKDVLKATAAVVLGGVILAGLPRLTTFLGNTPWRWYFAVATAVLGLYVYVWFRYVRLRVCIVPVLTLVLGICIGFQLDKYIQTNVLALEWQDSLEPAQENMFALGGLLGLVKKWNSNASDWSHPCSLWNSNFPSSIRRM